MRAALSFSRSFTAALLGALILALPARAADKLVAGTLGGQAPLWPIYIAVHKGILAQEGIDMELNFARSGAATVQQLTGGSLDVVVSVGCTDPMLAIDKGASLAIIRVIGNTPPYALVAKASIKSIKDLRGKTISTGAPSDITTIYSERMLSANGLKKGDYQVQSAGFAAARFAALKAGVADAAMVLPPLSFHAEETGYPIIALAADYVKEFPFTCMVVQRPWAEAHKDLVHRLLAATDKGVAWFEDPAHRKDAIDLLVQVAHSTPADADKSYDFIRKIDYFQKDSVVSRKRIANLVAIERQYGLVGPKLTVDALVLPGITTLGE
jgi:ABC-type nitrate/sulfonate/bicarbonate transport system substrate-binding protein